MIQVDEIDALLNQIATRRLRFENIVNELVDNGLLTKSELVISPERTTVYNFERDIRDVQHRTNDHQETLWQLNIPRDGFYDTLPERLFHRAQKRTRDDDQWAEIRRQEENQEQESRHFFLPFDNEFNHRRTAIARFETQAISGDDSGLLTELLKLIAPQTEALNLTQHQKLTLFLIIVQAHYTIGNWEQTASHFSSFLQTSVRIQYGGQVAVVNRPQTGSNWQPNRLGTGRLGMDWVLPPVAPPDAEGLILLTLGPLTDTQLRDFLPGGIGLDYVELLAGYLFPVDADWRLDVLPDAVNDSFRLSANGVSGRLGLTTTLN